MRIRHLALLVLGIAAAAFAVQLAAPGSNAQPPVLDDGTINVTASEQGRGAWVPYTITVRNLGDHDFSGRLAMVKRVQPVPASLPRVAVTGGRGPILAPAANAGQANPPDAVYQFAVALSPRHKSIYRFQAPDDFLAVVVQDPLGRQVAEGEVDARKSIAVGTLTDSISLAAELESIRLGDIVTRVTRWDDANPFPNQAAYLSGLSAVVVGRFDSGRLGKEQLAALSEFVGLGGELVLSGGTDLARTTHALPAEIVPFAPAGGTILESLAPVAELSGLASDLVAPVATGTLVPGATTFIAAADGRPLAVETRFGSGRVVELLFDVDSPAAGAAGPGGLSTVAFTEAIVRGLDKMPGADLSGRTLLDPEQLPAVLFPRPSDSPFPPLWLVGGLLAFYLVMVMPANYLAVRRLGGPGLFWVTTPALAVGFTLVSYLVGHLLQAGIRDQEIQLYKIGPSGIASRVDVHGLAFPARGDRRLSFGSDRLVAPYTIGFPDLSPSCLACSFPAGASGGALEEDVLEGTNPVIDERGLVYGSVRVVGSAAAGRGGLDLAAHLASVDGRITGTIQNTGRVTISGLLVYTYYQGAYRAAVVAPGLAPGASVRVDAAPIRIAGVAPQPAPGTRLTAGQAISIIADEAGRRTLSHPGQLAIVGFVKPVDSQLAVDGVAPGGQVVAAFGMPVEVESASGRLGDVAVPRLAASHPETATFDYVDAYDISLPSTSGPLVLRYEQRLYSQVQVYDWQARTWRPGPFTQDPASPLVMFARLDPTEVRDGLVRVRVREGSLSWGSDLTVRFPGEAP